MFLSLLLVAGGLVILIVASDRLVVAAVRVSASLGISAVLIGAIVVGLGTSLPELLVSAIAAGDGELDVAMANVVGSNVSNVTLVAGAAALVLPLGGAFCAGAWWLALVSGLDGLFPVALLLVGAGLFRPRGPWQWAEGPSLRGALAPFLAVVALLALTHFGWNRVGPEGDETNDPQRDCLPEALWILDVIAGQWGGEFALALEFWTTAARDGAEPEEAAVGA